ncbi:two-component system regulatory protein YycI [Limosilactobacillus avium]|uniref:two-component system regulatory protein YycI n=1 Tax=Limosilactobacillus avium TaxID=2991831 RepID=UPI0024BA7F18|nr:two-component system regulatory protein YycI [Limosilactobacillus avium]
MNFKRIQWIFLFAFLAFDIIVGCELLFQGSRFTISNSQQGHQTAVLKEMRADSITYTSLSKHQPSGYYISGTRSGDGGQLEQQMTKLRNQTARFSDSELNSEFDSPIKVSHIHPNYRLNQVIKSARQVPLGTNYRYNAQLSDKKTVVYTQMVKGQPILDNDGQVRFHLNNGNQVTGYTQGYVENPTTLQQRATAISQQHAVIWLYRHNQIPNDSQIRWAILGYTKLLTTNNHDRAVYVPTWVVQIKTKTSDTTQRLNVNAFNSTVMKTSPDTVNMDSIK